MCMKTYVVGDLQGCHGETVTLVEKILETEHAAGREPPAILFCGDLINRGPDSLSTLRYVQALSQGSDGRFDAVIVGAGGSGMRASLQLAEAGLNVRSEEHTSELQSR